MKIDETAKHKLVIQYSTMVYQEKWLNTQKKGKLIHSVFKINKYHFKDGRDRDTMLNFLLPSGGGGGGNPSVSMPLCPLTNVISFFTQ